MTANPDHDRRFLLLAPTPRDAELSRTLLAEAGIAAVICDDVAALCRELGHGAGAALISEEALAGGGADLIAAALAQQPPWSDLPLVVLTGESQDSPIALQILESFGNVTLLQRPLRVSTLISSARSALRARARQYQIRDHLDETRRINSALQEADRSKDEFLAMLSHELRNPLAPIRNALSVLSHNGAATPEAARMRDVMDRQLDHLVRLVDDLLDVSRILRGKIDLRIERLDLANVIARAVETAQPVIDAQAHQLTVSLHPTAIEIDGDLVRLSQVFANLLQNAAKYTERSGHIWLTAERVEGEAVVRVGDDGIGIAADMLPKVFELFRQAERSLDRSQGGLGLGLTLVQRLVEMHGGKVSVSSEGPGRGSEFVVRLPAPAPDAPPARAREEGRLALAPSGPRRVLVVDDNVDAAESLAVLLRLGGHEVDTAYHGVQAIALAGERSPDVVFLDIGLPGMDGFEVARVIRANAAKSPLLVAITGYGQEEDRRRSMEAGFDLHLAKPVRIEDLVRALVG